MADQRFESRQDAPGHWSVFDNQSNMTAVIGQQHFSSLDEDDANEFATILNNTIPIKEMGAHD